LNHGAQVDLETQNADTPFHLATYQNHTEIVSILVEKFLFIYLFIFLLQFSYSKKKNKKKKKKKKKKNKIDIM